MKVAIIGTGEIAHVHAQNIIRLNNTISIICSNNINNAIAFAKKYSIKDYINNIDYLLDYDFDVIHICSPPLFHYEYALLALENNKHVICEKPLCFSEEEALELLNISKKNNLIFALNFNNRFYDINKSIINELDNKSIKLITGYYKQAFHLLPTQYSWRYNKELAGPLRATSEIGSHLFDLLSYITKFNITRVSAHFKNYHPKRYLKENIMSLDDNNGKIINISSEDVSIITFEFNGNAIGNIILSEISHGNHNNLGYEITCLNKTISWNSSTANQYQVSTSMNEFSTKYNAFSNGFNDTYDKFFTQVYLDINSNIHSIETIYANIEDGYNNVILCNALLRSAHNDGAWIDLELKEKIL